MSEQEKDLEILILCQRWQFYSAKRRSWLKQTELRR